MEAASARREVAVRRHDRRWVHRNEDKPHRCPECHAVATWEHKRYGPRTVLVCPRECVIRWRVGRRLTVDSMRYRRWLVDIDDGLAHEWWKRSGYELA